MNRKWFIKLSFSDTACGFSQGQERLFLKRRRHLMPTGDSFLLRLFLFCLIDPSLDEPVIEEEVERWILYWAFDSRIAEWMSRFKFRRYLLNVILFFADQDRLVAELSCESQGDGDYVVFYGCLEVSFSDVP